MDTVILVCTHVVAGALGALVMDARWQERQARARARRQRLAGWAADIATRAEIDAAVDRAMADVVIDLRDGDR